MRNFVVLAAILLTATACGDTWGQRAVTGGAVGTGVSEPSVKISRTQRSSMAQRVLPRAKTMTFFTPRPA